MNLYLFISSNTHFFTKFTYMINDNVKPDAHFYAKNGEASAALAAASSPPGARKIGSSAKTGGGAKAAGGGGKPKRKRKAGITTFKDGADCGPGG